MAECKRRLKKVNVQFISLVGAGANGKAILWKSTDASENPLYEKHIQIVKQDDEQRLVYGIVYAPDEVDSQGDTASAETIKAMAYGFMQARNTINVDKQHNGISSEGYVAESWLVKAGDPVFPDQPAGSWAVAIKVENDTTWNAVKSGEIGGLSLAGLAEVEDVQKSEEPTGIIQKIRQLLSLDGAPAIEKAGRMISAANAAKIQDVISVLQALVSQPPMLEDEPEPTTNTQTQKEDAMSADEVTKAIADAITAAMKPIEDKLAAVEKAQAESAARIDQVAKATDGSDQLKANEKKTDKIWT